jgi:hypothetical protein
MTNIITSSIEIELPIEEQKVNYNWTKASIDTKIKSNKVNNEDDVSISESILDETKWKCKIISWKLIKKDWEYDINISVIIEEKDKDSTTKIDDSEKIFILGEENTLVNKECWIEINNITFKIWDSNVIIKNWKLIVKNNSYAKWIVHTLAFTSLIVAWTFLFQKWNDNKVHDTLKDTAWEISSYTSDTLDLTNISKFLDTKEIELEKWGDSSYQIISNLIKKNSLNLKTNDIIKKFEDKWVNFNTLQPWTIFGITNFSIYIKKENKKNVQIIL